MSFARGRCAAATAAVVVSLVRTFAFIQTFPDRCCATNRAGYDYDAIFLLLFIATYRRRRRRRRRRRAPAPPGRQCTNNQ